MRFRLGKIVTSFSDTGDMWTIEENEGYDGGHKAIGCYTLSQVNTDAGLDSLPGKMRRHGFSIGTATAPLYLSAVASMAKEIRPASP